MQIKRYPISLNKSLRAWSAADEYLIRYLEEHQISPNRLLVYQDRFGYLSCHLHAAQPIVVANYKSQEKAIVQNLSRNKLNEENITLTNSLTPINQTIDLVLMRIPKSLDLLHLYFQQMSQALSPEAIVLGGFMTKYFSPKILSIAAEYFEEVEQSLAWKKSRLLILRKPKTLGKSSIIKELKPFNDTILRQYFGVFSANQVDIGTQFLVERMELPSVDGLKVLDLACGNGVLGLVIKDLKPKSQLHFVDDDYLAVASAKLNLAQKENCFFYYNDNLDDLEDDSIDFCISNPPFHFEHETNIEVSIKLFEEVKRVLRPNGVFQLVANKHLNYKTHLQKLFKSVKILAENNKFIIYSCSSKL